MAVQSEADLPPNLTCLKNVDSLLRCPICFDFLSISMMTKCSHNFCSLCIRKFLSYKLQCPVCNMQTTVQDLRNNRLLDELVQNLQVIRVPLSTANFDSPPISPNSPTSDVKCRTPRGKGPKYNGSILSHFFQKGPKTSPAKKAQEVGSTSQCFLQGEMQTAHTHNPNNVDLHSPAAQPPLAVKEELMDEEEASAQNLMSVKQKMTNSFPLPQPCKADSSSSSRDIKPVIKVECPVCSLGIPKQFINKHLDTCLTRGEKKESLRSSIVSKRRPMGMLVYNLLSLQELKRKLKECHLSVQGHRDQLVKRHQEFVHVYNSQCDSLDPKSAEDIAKEVETNEKTRNQLQGKAKPVMVFSKNQSEEEIDEVHSKYRKQHSNAFSRLLAQVQGREGRKSSRLTRIKQEVVEDGEEAQEPHTADPVADSKSCSLMTVSETGADEEASTSRSVSSSDSDGSISSSISDVFGPEPDRNFDDTKKTSVRKRTFSSREKDASPPLYLGKRRRKT